jgi:hypothetical protein
MTLNDDAPTTWMAEHAFPVRQATVVDAAKNKKDSLLILPNR